MVNARTSVTSATKELGVNERLQKDTNRSDYRSGNSKYYAFDSYIALFDGGYRPIFHIIPGVSESPRQFNITGNIKTTVSTQGASHGFTRQRQALRRRARNTHHRPGVPAGSQRTLNGRVHAGACRGPVALKTVGPPGYVGLQK